MRLPRPLELLLRKRTGKCHCVYCAGTRDDLVEYAANLEMELDVERQNHALAKATLDALRARKDEP